MNPPPNRPRFTPDGSPELEQHLDSVCGRVLDGVRSLVPTDRLDGILLGGGYGRGEGGVLREPSQAGDQPYNDLEFYVFIRGVALLAERVYRRPLHDLGERLSPEAGLEVEFKVITLAKLRRSSPSMFYYDLFMGHRWIAGDDALLAGAEHHRDASAIPLHEATRLLMNRCSGLLFSAERLARANFGAAEADFVGRNLAKACLAFGDVVLTCQGRYHWSCLERHRRLTAATPEPGLPLEDLIRLHRHGVDFKFHPFRSCDSRADLAARHRELVELGRKLWLWLETRRLGFEPGSPRAYATGAHNLCPETSPFRNRLVNARAFGAGAALSQHSARYPRERLLRSLALLLFEPGTLQRPEDITNLQSWLRTSARDLSGLTAAYHRLWSRFN